MKKIQFIREYLNPEMYNFSLQYFITREDCDQTTLKMNN